MKTAVIAGASGLVGSELLNQLIDNNYYDEIHLLLRKKLELNSPKVIQHIIDFDSLNNVELSGSVDHVFCTLGTTIKKAKTKDNFRRVDYDYVYELGKKAKQWKAQKFLVVSSLGANAKSKIFYNRIKGEIEMALSELGLNQLFIFRPSLLMGDRKEQRAGEKSAIAIYKVINPLFVGRLKRYKGIQAGQVAKGMIETANINEASFKIFESDEIQNF